MTATADLYSLGCLLFELLSGHKPFEGTNFAVLFEQHLRKPAPRVSSLVSDCPPVLVNTIAQLLEKDPNQRPFNARAVQGVMHELLDSPAASATPARPVVGKQDVAAASVKDPGMASLAVKLGPSQPRQVSWAVLSSLVLAVIVLILIAKLVTR